MLLNIEHVTKTYSTAHSGQPVIALEDIQLKIPHHQFICLIGPSGCGKSTLLHLMAGLSQPTSGSLTLQGRPIIGPSPERALVFQEFSLYPWMTVLDNVIFGLKAQKKRSRGKCREEAKRFLKKVGLKGFDQAYPHQLSGGMKQKVALARTLALEPKVLLLDEPFAALDEQTRFHLDWELLELWKQEPKTVILVTHAIEDAIILADRIVLFSPRPGRIQQDIMVPLPRPRDLFSPEVTKIRKFLWQQLQLCCPPDRQATLNQIQETSNQHV